MADTDDYGGEMKTHIFRLMDIVHLCTMVRRHAQPTFFTFSSDSGLISNARGSGSTDSLLCIKNMARCDP